MKFAFDPDEVRHGFGLAKLVRPLTGDYVLRFSGGTLSILSSDRRRYSCAFVKARSHDAPEGFESDEFFLSADRQTLFDAKLSTMAVTLTAKGLQVRAEEEGQHRQALIRRRPDNSRRPKALVRKLPAGGTRVKAASFEELMHHVSCSALIRETKTEQDMRVNQVHFYPEERCAVANARTYASAAYMPELALDLSVVSADIPVMRAFCSKCGQGHIVVGQGPAHLSLLDEGSGSYMLLSRVATGKPPLSIVSQDEYAVELEVRKDDLVSAVSWAKTAVEGTSRVSLLAVCAAEGGPGELRISASGQEIASIPVQFRKGRELRSDFHVAVLSNVVPHISGDTVVVRYLHPKSPAILELTSADRGDVTARHFVASMKVRA